MHLSQIYAPVGEGIRKSTWDSLRPQKGQLRVQGHEGVLLPFGSRLGKTGRLGDLPLEARQGREG